ncbi:MAG TPA: PqqD family peptide modification chaperone [Allosphingosinicella sp.]
MENDLVVSRRGELIETEVDGELVALHIDNGVCYGFNNTATRIWSLIEEPKRVSEIREVLLREYEVEPEACEAQLRDLLGELESDGLIELKDGPPS